MEASATRLSDFGLWPRMNGRDFRRAKLLIASMTKCHKHVKYVGNIALSNSDRF